MAAFSWFKSSVAHCQGNAPIERGSGKCPCGFGRSWCRTGRGRIVQPNLGDKRRNRALAKRTSHGDAVAPVEYVVGAAAPVELDGVHPATGSYLDGDSLEPRPHVIGSRPEPTNPSGKPKGRPAKKPVHPRPTSHSARDAPGTQCQASLRNQQSQDLRESSQNSVAAPWRFLSEMTGRGPSPARCGWSRDSFPGPKRPGH